MARLTEFQTRVTAWVKLLSMRFAVTDNTPKTLNDTDITTSRKVSRRSLVLSTGLAFGITSAALIASTTSARAGSDRANTYDNDANDRRPSTDND